MIDLLDPRATARLATDLAFEGDPKDALAALGVISTRWAPKMKDRIGRIHRIVHDPHMDQPELIERLRASFMRLAHLKAMHANLHRFRVQLSPEDALDTQLVKQVARAMYELTEASEDARRDLGDAIHACNMYAQNGRVTAEAQATQPGHPDFVPYAGPFAHPATRAGADVLLRQAAHVLVEL